MSRALPDDLNAIRAKPLLSIAGAARLLNWGVSKAYEAARRGELPGVVSVNGRLHVRTAVLVRWIDGDDLADTARATAEPQATPPLSPARRP
jgi:hypothetical protein